MYRKDRSYYEKCLHGKSDDSVPTSKHASNVYYLCLEYFDDVRVDKLNNALVIRLFTRDWIVYDYLLDRVLYPDKVIRKGYNYLKELANG